MTQQVDSRELKLLKLVEALELPDSAYDAAEKRYKDLGQWLERPESKLAFHDPHVHAQGSFALGTAIRPLIAGEEYDLDLACRLQKGASRLSHSQEDVKTLIGQELESYRQARKIADGLEEKNRCWRLNYQDTLRFHMDVVPAIPAEDARRVELSSLMENAGMDRGLAQDVAAQAVWITDRRSPGYTQVQLNWPASNPEGYVKWFVARMQPQRGLLFEARVEELPVYRRKTNLQRCIQLLKRHRDRMFQKNSDAKPISIIITTLAANAYTPGKSLADSMAEILEGLARFRQSNSDTVLNPVNPKENFADRWTFPEGQRLHLKQNFQMWVDQAVADFQFILKSADPTALSEHVDSRLAVRASPEVFSEALGAAGVSAQAHAPRRVTIEEAPKPWSDGSR